MAGGELGQLWAERVGDVEPGKDKPTGQEVKDVTDKGARTGKKGATKGGPCGCCGREQG